jgi:hypothetical protein
MGIRSPEGIHSTPVDPLAGGNPLTKGREAGLWGRLSVGNAASFLSPPPLLICLVWANGGGGEEPREAGLPAAVGGRRGEVGGAVPGRQGAARIGLGLGDEGSGVRVIKVV